MRSQTQTITFLTATILFGALATPAAAQISNTVQLDSAAPGKDGGLAGIALISTPQYQGSNETWKLAVPVIDYQWANGWFAGVSNGVGYNFSSEPMLDYGVRLTGNLGRREKRAKILRGMGDIKESAEISSFFNFKFTPNMGVNHSISYGAGNDHRGMLFNIEASFSNTMGSKLRAGGSLGASYANDNYMQSFFGVTQAQAQRAHLAQYTAKAGLRNTYVSGFVSYMVTDRTALSLVVASDRLAGDAKSSPLTKNLRSSSVVGAVTYHF
jgi:outer membrane protein